jgi:hypothetical protein
MPLASSDPQEDISVDVLGPQIIIWPMELLCHGDVLSEAAVDDGVGIRLRPILRVVRDIGRRLALVSQSITPRRWSKANHHVTLNARKPTRWLEIMPNPKLD